MYFAKLSTKMEIDIENTLDQNSGFGKYLIGF